MSAARGPGSASFHPSKRDVARLRRLLAPYEWIARPLSIGIENVPAKGPALLVGNHTLLGLLDPPALYLELLAKRGVFPRALGDHGHFRIPLWRDWLARWGVADGTPENCSRLLDAGEIVLVFPGGAREVSKRKGERYKLVWKERLGFARMAIRARCPVAPFAAVGVEDALDVVLDADEILASPAGRLLRRLGVREDWVMPMVRGVGPTPLPRLQRLYFRFLRPISTRKYKGDFRNDDACREVRDRVRAAVERGIAELLEIQARDPERTLGGRIRKRLRA